MPLSRLVQGLLKLSKTTKVHLPTVNFSLLSHPLSHPINPELYTLQKELYVYSYT